MLPFIDAFALGLLLGLGFLLLVFFLTLWRIRRRERRWAEADQGAAPVQR
ncbi:MAG: hypothetical protein WCB18_01170 [Thermoplasmata archaeon]